jgi:hypothetical protein
MLTKRSSVPTTQNAHGRRWKGKRRTVTPITYSIFKITTKKLSLLPVGYMLSIGFPVVILK